MKADARRDGSMDDMLAILEAARTVPLIDPAVLRDPPHLRAQEIPPVGTPLRRRQCPACGYEWPEP